MAQRPAHRRPSPGSLPSPTSHTGPRRRGAPMRRSQDGPKPRWSCSFAPPRRECCSPRSGADPTDVPPLMATVGRSAIAYFRHSGISFSATQPPRSPQMRPTGIVVHCGPVSIREYRLRLTHHVRLLSTLLVLALGCGSVSGKSDGGGGADGGIPSGGQSGAAGEGVGSGGAAGQTGTGAAGAAGSVGSAGNGGGAAGATGAGGAAGSPGRPLGAGCTDDTQCGSDVCAKTSASATSGTCCSGKPDACNTCVGGYLTPVQDGTACGGGLCDGVAPYVGQKSCTATNLVCMGGACTMTTVNCCTKLGCATGQSACTGSAEDPTQPVVCTAVCE